MRGEPVAEDAQDAADVAVLKKLELRLDPEPRRTVLRPFVPGEPPEVFANPARPRAVRIVAQILQLRDDALDELIERLLSPLRGRHRDLEDRFLERFDQIASTVEEAGTANERQRLAIGLFFTEEYAFESTALFNPSVVRHPNQSGLEEGAVRFVLSLRGIGEGHLSSVIFRTGVWHADETVTLDDVSPFAIGPRVQDSELPNGRTAVRLHTEGAREISETVIYPFLPSQGRGIEDVRMVEFTDGDGRRAYRGTFTAFNGMDVRQGLLLTSDFATFEMRGVEGDLYGGKGMALFPRMVGDRYAMLSRQDNESVWLVLSDDLYKWSGGSKLLIPEQPWETVQMGNCGSPIEIDEGFLVLTHGVGGVRNYSVGAVLLDKDNPSRVIGRMTKPLLEPEDERDGYVPNVVYSCGALLRGRRLLLPYGVADSFTRFAVVDIDALLTGMKQPTSPRDDVDPGPPTSVMPLLHR